MNSRTLTDFGLRKRLHERIADVGNNLRIGEPRLDPHFVPFRVSAERLPGLFASRQIVERQHVREVGHVSPGDGLAEKHREHVQPAKDADFALIEHSDLPFEGIYVV